jgi:hypothetical protein
MKIYTAIIAALWLCLSFASPASADEQFRGQWTLSPSHERGKIQLALTLINPAGEKSRHASDWPVTAFNVLDLQSSGKHEVTFVIDRAAGRIKCRGFIEGGEGSGVLTFEISPAYVESLRSRGEENADVTARFAAILRELSAPQS